MTANDTQAQTPEEILIEFLKEDEDGNVNLAKAVSKLDKYYRGDGGDSGYCYACQTEHAPNQHNDDTGNPAKVSEAQGDTPTPGAISDHTVGSHSDDRGGAADAPCYCTTPTPDNLCPGCDGTGSVYQTTCSGCNGTGRIEHSASDSKQSWNPAGLPCTCDFENHHSDIHCPVHTGFNPSQSSTTVDDSWLDEILDEFETNVKEWHGQSRSGGSAKEAAKLAITDSLRGNSQDPTTPTALSNKADNSVELAEKRGEMYGRANEHHVISRIFDNDDLAALKPSTVRRLKARQAEVIDLLDKSRKAKSSVADAPLPDSIQGQTGRTCTCCGGSKIKPNQVDNSEVTR